MEETIDYKKGKFIIATTDIDTSDEMYRDYIDWCKENDIEPKAEDSYEFYEWAGDETQENWECDMDNIECFPAYNQEVVIEGTLGLWFGKRDIVEVVCNSVKSAIDRISSGNYDKILEVEWNDGVINVTESHHDGTNFFTIRLKDKRRKLPYLYA